MNIAELDELVANMRRLGVRSYKTKNLEIELTDPPRVEAEPKPVKSELQVRNEERARAHDILFAASSVRPRIGSPL